MQKTFVALLASALLFAGLASSASAQVEQDGLVNIAVNDVTVQANVALADVVDVVANLCPNVNVSNLQIAILARAVAVDRGGARQVAVCRNEDNDQVTITQNAESTG